MSQIYFAGSISGGRHFLETHTAMVHWLQNHGHHVLTEHIINPNVFTHEAEHTDQYIYERDIAWLQQADCLISEVSNPSLGVGYEICFALNIGKPVLCLYHADVFLTRMLTGNTRSGLDVKMYNSDSAWQTYMQEFLEKL